MNAAVAAEIARKNGKLEFISDEFMSGRVSLDIESMNKLLVAQGCKGLINTPKDTEYRAIVAREVKLAQDLKLKGTPTLFVLDSAGRLFQVNSLDLVRKMLR